MNTVTRYIVLKDNRIVKDYQTAQGIEGIHASLHSANVDHDEILQVPVESDCMPGKHREEYDTEWKLKPLSVRVAAGHVLIPENHTLDGEQIRPMNTEEKVRAGTVKLDPLMIAEGDTIRPKTEDELIATGVKTRKQIDEEKLKAEEERLIAEEERKILREQALARLGDKIKVAK